jgi:hypothetical protein
VRTRRRRRSERPADRRWSKNSWSGRLCRRRSAHSKFRRPRAHASRSSMSAHIPMSARVRLGALSVWCLSAPCLVGSHETDAALGPSVDLPKRVGGSNPFSCSSPLRNGGFPGTIERILQQNHPFRSFGERAMRTETNAITPKFHSRKVWIVWEITTR